MRRPTGTGFTIAVEDEQGKVGEVSELFQSDRDVGSVFRG